MSSLSFFSHVNIGDNFEQLHFLRRLVAKYPDLQCTQYIKPEVLPHVGEVIEDTPQIAVKHVDERPNDATNSWLACDDFIHKFPGKNADHVRYMLAWFQHLAHKVGLESPHSKPEDLLFDYPALLKPTLTDYDILFINSAPLSGQLRSYNSNAFNALAHELASKNRIITTDKCDGLPCTRDFNLTLTGIGSLSRHVHSVIGVATGPLWPTLNIWNHNRLKLRIIMVDHEQLRYDASCKHASSIDQARSIVKEANLI